MPPVKTIWVDTREKTPLPPVKIVHSTDALGRLRTYTTKWQRRTLRTADYALASGGGPSGVGVERKKGIRELTKNCLTGGPRELTRFQKCLDRLAAEFRVPILMLEADHHQLLRPQPGQPHPARVTDALMAMLIPRRIHFWVFPGRTQAQREMISAIVARTLIKGVSVPSPPDREPSRG